VASHFTVILLELDEFAALTGKRVLRKSGYFYLLNCVSH